MHSFSHYENHEAISAHDLSLTYGKLAKIVAKFINSLAARGVQQGDFVVLRSRDIVACVGMTLATHLLHCRIMMHDEQADAAVAHLVTHRFQTVEMTPPVAGFEAVDGSWMATEVSTDFPQWMSDPSDCNALFWILTSSGSTGKPKLLGMSFEDFYQRTLSMSSDFERARVHFCSLFPCFSRSFIIRAIACLLRGGRIVDTVERSFMQRRGVNLLFGSPFVLRQWLDRYPEGQRLPVVQVTGGVLDAALCSRLLDHFDEVQDVYGSAEAGRVYTTSIYASGGCLIHEGHGHDTVIDIQPDPAWDEGARQRSGGRILLKNSHISSYAFNETQRDFVRRSEFGQHLTSDLGYWDDHGALRLAGRIGNVVNVGGAKIALEEIDAALMKTAHVIDGVAFEVTVGADEILLCALVVLSDGVEEITLLEQISRQCIDILGQVFTPPYIIAVKHLPRLAAGKVDRAACARIAETVLRDNRLKR